ncbi:MAG: hypothetical protein ACI3XR_08925, partial [Eubacteriales bacterium]
MKVNSLERQTLGHGAERTAEDGLREQYKQHGADSKDMHHLPGEMMAKPGSKPSAALNGSKQDNVKHGKEYGKITPGRNPKLDVAHALERALYLGHAGYEAYHREYRNGLTIHGQHIAYAKDDGRTAKQLFVGEAELHAEKHREIDSHARKGGIKQEKNILNHKVGGATDAFQRSKVHTTAELEAKG